eukprot:6209625-Pleurochrysis_carterae.AAC.1
MGRCERRGRKVQTHLAADERVCARRLGPQPARPHARKAENSRATSSSRPTTSELAWAPARARARGPGVGHGVGAGAGVLVRVRVGVGVGV